MNKRRPLKKISEPERWKQYKNMNLYVSDQGRCKKIYNGKEYEVGYFANDPSKRVNVVKLTRYNVPIKNLVWELFRGEIPKGYCVVHKSLKRDDSVYNLECIPREKHGSRIGKYSNSQKVVDLDKKVIYRSASEASRKLHICRQSICSICRGLRKNPVLNVAWWDGEKAYRGEWIGEAE